MTQKWDFVVGSPQTLFRAIEDLMREELHYTLSFGNPNLYNYPKLQQTGITNVATFEGWIKAIKVFTVRKLGLLIAGIVSVLLGLTLGIFAVLFHNPLSTIAFLIVGIALIIIGVIFIRRSPKKGQAGISVSIKGESYRVSTSLGKDNVKEDRSKYGIVSEGRMYVWEEENVEINVPSEIKKVLDMDYERIRARLNEILAKYAPNPAYLI